ncbi:MAG: restriction endonuclease subunit S [bacterium]
MNAKRVVTHYERIADAPDAIVRLRRLILDLAVRGRLVPQDPQDDPASKLLKRIAAEKARLVKARDARKSEVEPFDPEDAPFLVPRSWAWTRLGSVGDWGSGSTPSRGNLDLYGGGITWLKSGELNDNRQLAGSEETVTELAVAKGSFRLNRPGDVLIAMYGATIGKVAILAENAVTNQAVCACTPFSSLFNQFLFLFLLSQREQLHSVSEGGAQPNISKVKIVWMPFPLPPLAEQHRIVAKVDDLMALCDRLEVARGEREATRDRLAAASLARVNAPDPETFHDDARFALNALPALTTRADQINQLRQTIFNLAVRGKLEPQDPKDEPASELLKRITAEKARTNKHQQNAPEIDHPKELGDLPSSWCAVPLIALGSWAIGSGFPKNEQGLTDGPHFFLKVSDMNLPGNEKYIITSNNFIDDNAAGRMRAKIHPPRTIIFPKIGGAIATNKRRILTRGAAIDNNCLGITFSSEVNIEWAYLLLTTLDFTQFQVGTAVPALQQGVLERIPVGLPPLAEQHRVVAKVDELIALCDRLEASLITGEDTRRCLLDASLHEALAPAA